MKRERRREEIGTFIHEHREELAQAKKLQGAADTLSSMRRQSDRILRSDESPEEKRTKLDALTFRMIDVASRALGRKKSQGPSISKVFPLEYGGLAETQ